MVSTAFGELDGNSDVPSRVNRSKHTGDPADPDIR